MVIFKIVIATLTLRSFLLAIALLKNMLSNEDVLTDLTQTDACSRLDDALTRLDVVW